jgi:glycosyltransferase involved in cell wall biosynthesis
VKIFHVLHGFAPELRGGTERTVEALARAMARVGHEVAVVCGSLQSGSPAHAEELDHDGLRVLRFKRDDLHFESWEKAWSPGASAGFEALIARERPDVVHVHHWIRLTTELVRIAQALDTPVVACTLHDYWSQLASPVRSFGDDSPRPPESPPWLGRAEAEEAFLLHRADLLDEVRAADLRFAPCRAHAIGLEQMAEGPLGDILLSPPPLLEVPPRRQAAAEPRGRRLLYWGSIYPEKGLETVFDALFSIGSGWELHVLGDAHDPVYREQLRQRAHGMPVVHFHGQYEPADIASVPADYAILPSTCHESYGLVLDEAQCVGLPILAADLPAYREHAPEESCAFFCPNDPGDLAMLLLDEARLGALQAPPMPELVTPAGAAKALLTHYEEVRVGEHGPLRAAPAVDDRRRAEAMFRRAERRFWSALQRRPVVPPPEGFLGGE